MITDFQKEKLVRFFKILDFDGNGVIEEDDFTAIAENLCILWGLREGEKEYEDILERYRHGWRSFDSFVKKNNGIADRGHWLKFASMIITKASVAQFRKLVCVFVSGIFSNFDVDNDGVISLDEFVDIFVAHRIEVRFSAKAFTKIDINGDDEISKEEFIDALSDYFLSNDPKAPGNLLFGQ